VIGPNLTSGRGPEKSAEVPREAPEEHEWRGMLTGEEGLTIYGARLGRAFVSNTNPERQDATKISPGRSKLDNGLGQREEYP